MATNFVFTIAGAKGGVGKTTTSINLAAALSARGYAVVAVEMDLPMPNFADFLDLEFTPAEDPSLPDVLRGDTGVQDAVYETANGISVVPSASDLTTFDTEDLEAFPSIIDELRWFYDIVIIDTPAGLSNEAKRSLEVCDESIIISTPRKAAIQDATRTIELARSHDASIRGFILNKSGSGASPGVDAIAEGLDVQVLGHVPEDDAVPHSQDLGQPVVTKEPNSGAGIAYTRLAEILTPSGESPEDEIEEEREQPSISDPEESENPEPVSGTTQEPDGDAVEQTDVEDHSTEQAETEDELEVDSATDGGLDEDDAKDEHTLSDNSATDGGRKDEGTDEHQRTNRSETASDTTDSVKNNRSNSNSFLGSIKAWIRG